jgi:hypothetical protein
MTDHRKLLKQASDALAKWSSGRDMDAVELNDLVFALEAALAEPEQEPVAWMVYTQDGQSAYVTDNPTDIASTSKALPLYTAPPQRSPLTDEEIMEIMGFGQHGGRVPSYARNFVRAIERKVRGE